MSSFAIRRFFTVLTPVVLFALVSTATPASAQPCEALPGCVLVWADEFDGTAVDLGKWTFQLGDGSEVGLPGGWGNNELQYYQADNATVAGGLLTIAAKEESVGGLDYTSSRLRSLGKGDWTFGRMEMRAKMPIGQGLWPAFRMLASDTSIYGPWAASGEIDIVESIGSDSARIFGTIEYGASFPGNVFSSTDYTLSSGTFNDDFHVFAIEWEFGEIRWYLDGVQFASRNSWFSTGGPFPAPFDVDFHLLLNLAVGGNLPGPPDGTSVFPQEFVIDYVRVYQVTNDPPVAEITSPTAGDTLTPGDDITITVDATDDGSIVLVQFLQDRAILGEDGTAPYELTVPSVAAGCYTLRAWARDDGGKLAASDPVDIMVGTGCPQAPYLMTPAAIPGTVEAESYDLGGQGFAYNDTDASNNGGGHRPAEGVDIEPTSDAGGGFNVGWVVPGEWIEYQVDVTAGTYDVDVRVASAAAGGTLHLEFDGVDKTGPITFAGTGGGQSWTTASGTGVALDAGVQTLRLAIDAGDFNVNKIIIGEPAPPDLCGSVFDDMEHGNPFGNGWFAFGGSVGGGGIGSDAGDLPPEDGGVFSLETGWGSGGVPGFFGGFGRTNPTDLTDANHFNFWINPDAGQDYLLEVNLQDDDDGDNAIVNPADEEFQYNCVVSPSGPCAISGGGWQLVSIPLADFFKDTSFLFGGNGVLDAVPTSAGGNGQLINVIFQLNSNSGADVTFRTDYWAFECDNTLVINEILQNPAAVSDGNGEWVELFNPQPYAIDIDGFTLADDGSNNHMIDNGSPLVIAAGGYLVLGRDDNPATNGGVSVDYKYSGFTLGNGADEVVLLDTFLDEVDRVEYDGGPSFPDPTGASMALASPTADNNLGSSWCTSSTPFGAGDLGTPGAMNDCPLPELVINEIMQNPAAVSDASGEWIELFNPTSVAVDINGFTLRDDGSNSHVIDNGGPLVIAAGGYLVLGNNADFGTNGGVTVNYRYSNFALGNGDDEVVLIDTLGNEIDRVNYDGGPSFPDPNGASMALLLPSFDNNVGTSWCSSSTPFGAGDSGTPGTFNDCPGTPEIYDLQGSGASSPFEDVFVITRDNVVTAVRFNGFFMQTPAARDDSDATTSNGIFVFTGGFPGVAEGDLVDIAGTVVEFFSFTQFDDDNVTVVVTSSGNPLPAPVLLDALNPEPGPFDPPDMERFEGMLVELANGVATGPTNNFGFAALTVGPARMFREPGIEFPSPFLGPPEWDGNQEVFEIDPDALGLPDADILATQALSAVGPVAFSFGHYQILPKSLTLGPVPAILSPVRVREPGEFTVGSLNLFRLLGGFAKLSAYIVDVLRSPDILAVQEVQDIVELQALADQIAFDDPTVLYTTSLIEGNDVGGIDIGFLTRQNIQIDSLTQVDPAATFVDPTDSSVDILHDRPPLLLEGSVQLGGGSFPIAVMAVHNRSQASINDPTDGARVRAKRFQQSVSIAEKAEALQVADPDVRLVVIGDFNAFEFTDGYVDTLGVITGDFVPGDNLVCDTEDCAGLLDNDLVAETLGLPAGERYSFVLDGNAQALDHALTSQALSLFVTDRAYGRGNADAAADLINDDSPANLALRASDHDGLVLFVLADGDGDGFAPPDDCDDADPESFPGSPEVCDGADNDCDGAIDNDCDALKMESSSIVAGGDVTVNLVNTYVDPIVVATVQYDNNTMPVVTRVSNVTPTSFDLHLQNPSGGTPEPDTVHYWVVERGVWTVDGVKLEANKYLSTKVDRKGAWLWGVPQTYSQVYAQPVVLGQVMTENDPRWSVFFAQGVNHFEPPTATTLKTGRHIGEDTMHARANETIGYIVVEAVHTNLAGVEFEAAQGLDTVQGVQNGPPFAYNFNNPFGTAPAVVVASSAGMDGGDGGWAQLHGPTAATTTQLFLSIDEDQIADTERSHTTEQVTYAAFAGPMVYPVPPMCDEDINCDDGNFCNGFELCDANQVCRPGNDPCPGRPCDEVGDVCLDGGTPKMESIIVGGGIKSTGHTANLVNSYVSPVIACTPVYDANGVPVVVRISNVMSGSFDLFLQNPGNLDPVTHDAINCLVVEEGSWMMDGHPVEAQKYLSVTTDKERNWLGTAQALTHGFTNPVVLGQVMSTNDLAPEKWSVYWQRGAAQNQPPSATALRNGKTVCEDPDGVRADETIGFIVFEQSNGIIAGVPFEAALGPDTVSGIDNGPPFDYTFNVPFTTAPTDVIVTQAGMDGSDGSWAYLFGAAFSTTTTLSLAVDEDQIFNAERGHTTEQVGYVAFERQVVFPRMNCTVDANCDDGNHCNGAETCDTGSGICQAGTPPVCDDGVSCTDDTCNEVTDNCDFVANDGNCDNGLFCDGVETCSVALDCLWGADPCSGGACDEGTDTCPGVGPVARMEWGFVEDVGGLVTKSAITDKVPAIGTRVYLENDYVDPVIVVSVRYAANTIPVVARLAQVEGHRFDVYLQNPSGNPVSPETVDYIVVEKGTWVIDGVALEAQKYDSTKTAHDGDWSQFDTQAYGQGFVKPVVLGQVMSINDANFSAFWSRGPSRSAPPSSTVLHTGKMVGEDPNTGRANETVGFIVIEAGHGFLGGVEFEAKVSTDSVAGVVSAPPYSDVFTTSFASPPAVAVATQTAMDGFNGGWMITFGAAPTSATEINLAGDEDQLSDTERSRATEQAAYVVFQTPGSIAP